MKARYFFIAAIVLALLAIVSLRLNSQRANELKTQVKEKDKAGQAVTDDLQALRSFVFTHMNSSVKFELTGAYERAAASAQQASQANATGDVYAQAQAACGQEVGTN